MQAKVMTPSLIYQIETICLVLNSVPRGTLLGAPCMSQTCRNPALLSGSWFFPSHGGFGPAILFHNCSSSFKTACHWKHVHGNPKAKEMCKGESRLWTLLSKTMYSSAQRTPCKNQGLEQDWKPCTKAINHILSLIL